jgi:hypothetical protein
MRYLLLVGAMLTIGVGILAQNQPRRDGDWEIKVEMQMPGMPMNMPAQTIRQCLTPQDVTDPQKSVPPAGRGRGQNDCKVSDYKTEGNKTTWSVSCPSEGMTGTGEFIYAENSYTGTMKMMAGGRDMTMKYTGKRLGDCTK